MKHPVAVEFAKSGWCQFAQMNRALGSQFIRSFILQRELTEYLAAYEKAGVVLDMTCQEVHYDGGIYLLLMKCQGVWYVTDIWTTDAPADFQPVCVWRLIQRGLRAILQRVLVSWRIAARESGMHPEKASI